MNASAQLTTFTRLGFAARGVLYIVIALLVIGTGRAEDPSGALQYLGRGGGRVLLILMAVGLVAYGIWRLSDAALDVERHGSDRDGMLARAGAGVSGLLHLILAWQAIRLIRGTGSSGDGTEQGTQAALQLPGGWALVILAGIVLVIVGALQLIKAVKGDFLDRLQDQAARQSWVQWTGRVGYAARGFVFLISGFFLLRAGFQEQASEAGGTAQALSWLSSPLDLLVAAGLLGFGLFSLVEARFRVIHDVPVERMARGVTGKH